VFAREEHVNCVNNVEWNLYVKIMQQGFPHSYIPAGLRKLISANAAPKVGEQKVPEIFGNPWVIIPGQRIAR
jgi:hypothetical protein